jgi:peptidoglycan hydrolase FlgJ
VTIPVHRSDQLAIESRSLADLRRKAASDPNGSARDVAKQFEVLFLNMLMKSMRESLPKDGMMSSHAGETYTGMLDQQLMQKMADRGTGLAASIERQLTRSANGGRDEPRALPTKHHGVNNRPPVSISFANADALKGLSSASNNAGIGIERGDNPVFDTNNPHSGFLQNMLSSAKKAEQVTGIPAKFMVGQAALESGWGKKEIRHPDGSPSFNLFGIKAGANWNGPTVSTVTTEYTNGVARKVVEKFRAYASYEQSFADYAALINQAPRYETVSREARTPEGFANALQRAGYATDPRYAEKLSKTINHVLLIGRSQLDVPA